MRWNRFVVATAIHVIWRGTWQAHSARLIFGALFAVIAALFSYLATGRASAWVGILAYPVGLVLIYGFDAVRWLTGWWWRWGRESSIQPNGVIHATILAKGPLMIPPMREREEDSCVIRDPTGQQFRADHVQAFRGQGMCLYPDWFPGAPKVTVGTYWILWQERKQIWKNGKLVGPGKWLPVDFCRIKISEHDLPAASPATPPSAAPVP